MYNTPPTFAWYIAGLTFKWLKAQGGLSAIAQANQLKADKLYNFIDQSDFYYNSVDPIYRSRMNIVFQLQEESLNQKFLEEATKVKLINLKGHKLVGGMRASIYNAMPMAGVERLINFMADFSSHFG
jgi:phosphoserine aminotransferase